MGWLSGWLMVLPKRCWRFITIGAASRNGLCVASGVRTSPSRSASASTRCITRMTFAPFFNLGMIICWRDTGAFPVRGHLRAIAALRWNTADRGLRRFSVEGLAEVIIFRDGRIFIS